MSSGIPYPHTAEVWRTEDGSGGGSISALDSWGNPALDAEDTILIDTIACWVQEAGPKDEQPGLDEAGDVAASHQVFCDPFAFGPTDFLVTVAGGGQVGAERHRILYIGNPDGGDDHLELLTLRVVRGSTA